MPDLLCPFSAPLIRNDFGCSNAREIVRRGGAEIACEQPASHALCSELHTSIRLSALAAMELEDDLLTLPHNVLVKIQYGGVLGLHALTSGGPPTDGRVDDISALVSTAMQTFQRLENIPLDVINETIIAYKTRRRGKH
jgi:hypothetical protein